MPRTDRNYEYKFNPKSIDRMPPGDAYLYGLKPINDLIKVEISFKYINDDEAMMIAKVKDDNKYSSSLTCSPSDICDLALFYLNEDKKYMYYQEFREKATKLLNEISNKLKKDGQLTLVQSEKIALEGNVGIIFHTDKDGIKSKVGTFESLDIHTPEILLPESKLISVFLGCVVLKPGFPIKSIGGLSLEFDDIKNGLRYNISGLSSVKTEKEGLIQVEALISKILLDEIKKSKSCKYRILPKKDSGRYSNVLFARDLSVFMKERYEILGIEKSTATTSPELSQRLVKVATGGRA
jgi:hypothetical protein